MKKDKALIKLLWLLIQTFQTSRTGTQKNFKIFRKLIGLQIDKINYKKFLQVNKKKAKYRKHIAYPNGCRH